MIVVQDDRKLFNQEAIHSGLMWLAGAGFEYRVQYFKRDNAFEKWR
jgi:hypothetical protein